MSFMLRSSLFRCANVAKYSSRKIASTSRQTRIGVIGCGHVGNAVTNNLLRDGFRVVAAYDVDKSKLDALPATVVRSNSCREVTENVDVVVSGLPKPMNVKAAAEGPDGILAALVEGKVWIDHSTTDYEQTQAYSEIAVRNGGHVLEAPITGGLEALKKGQMVVHVGGDRDVCEAVKPLLKASYSEVFFVGPIGSAMIVKVVSNMLACVHIVAMGEVLMLAKRAKIPLKTFWEAIRVSAGNSFVWETGAPVIFNGKYDPGFTIDLQCKDLQLGYDMARLFKVPMDMNQLALCTYRRTQYQLGDDAGCYSPPKVLEMALNESLNIPSFKHWSYDNEIKNGSLTVKHNNIE